MRLIGRGEREGREIGEKGRGGEGRDQGRDKRRRDGKVEERREKEAEKKGGKGRGGWRRREGME